MATCCTSGRGVARNSLLRNELWAGPEGPAHSGAITARRRRPGVQVIRRAGPFSGRKASRGEAFRPEDGVIYLIRAQLMVLERESE